MYAYAYFDLFTANQILKNPIMKKISAVNKHSWIVILEF